MINGTISEIIDSTKTIVKPIVNNGINIILAKTDIKLNVLKKYAIMKIRETVVEQLIAKLLDKILGSFILDNALNIGLYNKAIPNTQEKLISVLTSKIDKGLIKYTIIPASEIEEILSYCLNINGAINITNVIIIARTTETVNPHI